MSLGGDNETIKTIDYSFHFSLSLGFELRNKKGELKNLHGKKRYLQKKTVFSMLK